MWDNSKLSEFVKRDEELRKYKLSHPPEFQVEFDTERMLYRLAMRSGSAAAFGQIPLDTENIQEKMEAMKNQLLKILQQQQGKGNGQGEPEPGDGEGEEGEIDKDGCPPPPSKKQKSQSNEDWVAKLRKDLTDLFVKSGVGTVPGQEFACVTTPKSV